jgi:hypothetical protein
MLFDGKKTYAQVKEITDSITASFPEKVKSVVGIVRYMAHLDNPEKHQYSRDEIIGHCGADVAYLLKPSASTRYMLIREMSEYVRDNGIIHYSDLYFYAMEERYSDWFPLLIDTSTFVMRELIKSEWQKQQPTTRG